MKKYEVRNLKDCVLEANLQFGNSNVVIDRSPYHNNGTISGAKRDRDRMNFLRSEEDVIEIEDDPSLNGTNEITIESLCRSTLNGLHQGIVTKMNPAQATGYLLHKINTNHFGMWIGNVLGVDLLESDVAYTDSDVHHIVGVHRAGTNYLYVDGEEQTDTGNRNLTVPGLSLFIGQHFSNISNDWWNGDIMEVKIYDRGFSAEEVKKAYMDARLRYMHNLILPKQKKSY